MDDMLWGKRWGRSLWQYQRWEMRRAWIILLSWIALAQGSEEVVCTSHSTSSLSVNIKGGAFRRVRRPSLGSTQPSSAWYHQSPEFCGTPASLKVLLHFIRAQSCLTLYDPMDCSPPCSSARILQWFVISFSRRASQPRGRTCVSCIAGSFFAHWASPPLGVGTNSEEGSRGNGKTAHKVLSEKKK